MVSKREDSRDIQKFEFHLTHADIVDLMNDAQVQLDDGNVLSTQVFQVCREKTNGSQVNLQEIGEGDILIFRYNKVVVTEDPTTFTDVDVS